MAVSIRTPGGNINAVSRNINPSAQWLFNTTEIEEHTHTPSGYINKVPINLIPMFSDSLNTCAINKYTSMLSGDNYTVAIW